VDLEREAAEGANGVAAVFGTPALNIAATEWTGTHVRFHRSLFCNAGFSLVILMRGALTMAAAARDDGVEVGSHA